jgi:hypothetical protein
VRHNFDDWPTNALRLLLRYVCGQLDEFNALHEHHEKKDVHPSETEFCRVEVLQTHFRRCYWAISNELELRQSLKELRDE